MIGLLMRSVETGAILEMIYLDRERKISQRRVKVLDVNGDDFRAYCYNRKQQRIFKLESVLSIGPERTRKTAS